MIDHSLIDKIIDKSLLIQAIKTRELEMDLIINYLNKIEAVSFDDQINAIFELLYNSFGTSEVTADENYVLQILGSIPAFIAAQATPAIEEGVELTEDQLQEMEEQQQAFALKEEIIRIYAKFVVFINGALNDNLMLLADKVEQLLAINYRILPDCEAKKLYLYYLLNLLLAQPIENVELIKDVTEELRNYSLNE